MPARRRRYEGKNCPIAARFSDEERAALEKYRELRGKPLAAFVHDAAVKELRRIGLLPTFRQPEDFI